MGFPKIDKKRTGARIRILMEQAEVTPSYVAKYLSLSCVQTVYRWFEGVNIPTVDNLYALSRLFGVTVDYMLVGTNVVETAKLGTDSNIRVLVYYKKLLEMSVA